jgi:hypothetical protein
MQKTQPKRRLTLGTGAPAKPTYAPPPYTGSGTEVVDALTQARAVELGIPASRLHLIADWHNQKRPRRHAEIASRLRDVAERLAASNDNAPLRAAA